VNNNFIFPAPIGTEYNYVMASHHGRVVFLAGQIAKTASKSLHTTGRCGEDVDMTMAQQNAEIAAGQVLAWLADQLKPNEVIDHILRMTVYVAVGDLPFDISAVADAASGVLIDAIGERARHPRSVIGVARLPRNAPVLLEVTASISEVSGSECCTG